MDPPGRAGSVLDRLGLVVGGAGVAWTIVSAIVAGVDPTPVVAGQIAVGGALVGARLVASWNRWAVPAVAVAVTIAVTIFSLDAVFDSAPRAGPFGYSSITGAFYAQATIAGLMLASGTLALLRPVGALAAIVFALVPITTRTRSATILLFTLVIVAILARTDQQRRFVTRSFKWVIGGAIAGTLVLGVAHAGPPDTSPWTRTAADLITEHRIALWHDAVVMMVENPLTGVGPGNFGSFSPVARSDPDAPWAHNEFLQYGAELGIPGLLLLSAVFLWGLSRLIAREALDTIAILGAAGLTMLGVHACIEYVLQRPAVPILAAALLGTAIGPFVREDR
jgi:O-antigen ligase